MFPIIFNAFGEIEVVGASACTWNEVAALLNVARHSCRRFLQVISVWFASTRLAI